MSQQSATMTVAWVRAHVASIEQTAHDRETARLLQVGLWRAVLEAVAAGRCDDPAACADEALKAEAITVRKGWGA